MEDPDDNPIDFYSSIDCSLVFTAPAGLVNELGSARGEVDELAAAFVRDERVTWTATDKLLRATVRETGAWEDSELASADTDRLRSMVAWMACGNYVEDESDIV